MLGSFQVMARPMTKAGNEQSLREGWVAEVNKLTHSDSVQARSVDAVSLMVDPLLADC